MERNVALGGSDAVVVVLPLIMREGRHEQRLARPFGIGMLAIHLLEPLGGGLEVALLVQQVQTFVVELVGRVIEDLVLLAAEPVAERTACAERQHQEGQSEQAGKPMTLTAQSSRAERPRSHGRADSVSPRSGAPWRAPCPAP